MNKLITTALATMVAVLVQVQLLLAQETLQTVTDRGASTSKNITISNTTGSGLVAIEGNDPYIYSGLRFIDHGQNTAGKVKEWSIWAGRDGGTWLPGLGFHRYDAVNRCAGGICDMSLFLHNNGYVGIGTATPTQKLDVAGYVRGVSGFVGNNGLKLYGDNSSSISINVGTNGALYGNTSTFQEDGNSTAWRGKVHSANAAIDRQVFIGTYGSVAAIASHNYALNAWTDLYINTINGIDGGVTRFGNTIYGTSATFNESIGIGTTSPTAKLQINQNFNGTGPGLFLYQPNGSWGAQSLFNAYRYIQTNSHPDALDGNFKAFNVGAGGIAIGYSNTPNYNSGDAMYVNGNIGIGTTNPQGYQLAVAGNVIAESVKVELQGTWPDYVFKQGNKLLSLPEVEKYIQENKHLPEIPSEAEVKKEGIDLGQMDAKLLKKIEELTLHLIEQNKRIEELEKQLKK